MEKCYGAEERHDQLIVLGTGQCVLIYGHGEEDGQGFDYRHRFDRQPTAAELLKVITDHVDSLTDQKIITGYRWQGKNVYLSSENQFNFKAAYDVAVQTGGATLPIKFKLWRGCRRTADVPHIQQHERVYGLLYWCNFLHPADPCCRMGGERFGA